MDDERLPEPEPSGALVPPTIRPPTALATSAPRPPQRPSNEIARARDLFRDAFRLTFDALDTLGDSIASAVGLR